MPHHIEGGENVSSQTGHVMPDNQSGRSCTGSDVSLFVSVDSDKKGTSSDGAFDDAFKQENAKFERTQILLLSGVSWVGMLGTNLVYLAQIGRLAITIEVFHRTGLMGHGFVCSLQKNTTKCWSGRSPMANISGLETWNLLLLLQTSQLWMCTSVAHHSTPLLSAGTKLVPPI